MRVSQKAEYALRAMLELSARDEGAQAMRSADIAKRQRIPEKFLELILVELRRAGLVASQRGPVGGHRLARRAGEISVGDVWRAIDGTLTDNAPAGRAPDPFNWVWHDVNKAIAGVVDEVSLADIRKRAEAGRGVPDFNI